LKRSVAASASARIVSLPVCPESATTQILVAKDQQAIVAQEQHIAEAPARRVR
jgi:hypothetical protein